MEELISAGGRVGLGIGRGVAGGNATWAGSGDKGLVRAGAFGVAGGAGVSAVEATVAAAGLSVPVQILVLSGNVAAKLRGAGLKVRVNSPKLMRRSLRY